MVNASRIPLVVVVVAVLVADGIPTSASQSPATSPSDRAAPLRVASGTTLSLHLETPIHSSTTIEGDALVFRIRADVAVGGQVAIPRGTRIGATVTKVRPAFVNGRAQESEIRIRFNGILLVDGGSVPIDMGELRLKPDAFGGPGAGGTLLGGIMATAAGAVIGGMLGGRTGRHVGAAAGGAVAVVDALDGATPEGSDVDLGGNDIFETKLKRALDVPDPSLLVRTAAGTPSAQAERTPSAFAPPIEPDARPEDVDLADSTMRPDLHTGGATVTGRTAAAPGYTLRVSVDLVPVDTVVRDRRGRPLENLTLDDFRLFDDGIEQPIRAISRDEMPLALALVVDRSGSVAPIMGQVRTAAYQALQQLKREDEVSLFAFAGDVQLLEPLTTDRRRIANRIGAIQAGGGTNILQALDEAVSYLQRAAPAGRRAVILVSDNVDGPGLQSAAGITRLALDANAVIYSVKLSGGSGSVLALPLPGMPGARAPDAVASVARNTGGEVFQASSSQLGSALATTVSRLRQRYTLSYYPPASPQSGYRTLEVRLTDRFGRPGLEYTVHSRSGYYRGE